MSSSEEQVIKKFKYSCKKCDYFTNDKCYLIRHKKTNKHKNIDTPRSDKKMPDKCESCSYVPTSYMIYRRHKLTEHSSKEQREKDFTYYCKACDFGCFNKSGYIVHTESKRHQRRNE